MKTRQLIAIGIVLVLSFSSLLLNSIIDIFMFILLHRSVIVLETVCRRADVLASLQDEEVAIFHGFVFVVVQVRLLRTIFLPISESVNVFFVNRVA